MRTSVLIGIFILSLCSLYGNWESIGYWGGDKHTAFVSSKGSYFISMKDSPVFKSTDRGKSWRMILKGNGSDTGLREVGFVKIIEDEKNNVLYAGTTKGIWYSKDDGESWERLITGYHDIDSDEPKYIVSDVIIVNDTLFFGLCAKHKRGRYVPKIVLEYNIRRSELTKHEIPSNKRGITIIKLDYDDDFYGYPTVFVSDFSSGYYMLKRINNEWIWEKIQAPTKYPATGIRVNRKRNVLFLMTYGDWIYVGKRMKNRWIWKKPKEPKIKGLKRWTVVDLKIDPFNDKKIWFGCGCGLTSIFPKPDWLSNGLLWGIYNYESMDWKILRFFAYPATQIAFDRRYKTKTSHGISAKYVLVSVGGANPNVVESDDGGYRWRKDNKGIAGETINNVLCMKNNMFVQLAVSMNAIMERPYDSWKYFFRLRESRAYTRDVILLGENKNYIELLVATGYPAYDVKTAGLFKVRISKRTRRPEKIEKVVTGPIYRILHHPKCENKIIIARGDCKVQIYDMRKDEITDMSCGLLNKCGVWDIAVYTQKENELLVASIIEKDLSKQGFDLANYMSSGSIYVVKNNVWKRFYPRNKYKKVPMISSVKITKDGKLIALRSDGVIIYSDDMKNVVEKKIVIPKKYVKKIKFFTDIEIDESDDIAFISTFDAGVFKIYMHDILYNTVIKAEDYNDDIGTLSIRNLTICESSNYIFAGTQACSVWRRKY